jgi:hypothetical protein
MKTKLISPNRPGNATVMQARLSEPASAPRRRQISRPEPDTENMTTLESNLFTTSQFIDSLMADNPNYSPYPDATAARQRFLAEHGPGADLPRRRLTSKEFRKALLAAEMARWQCF